MEIINIIPVRYECLICYNNINKKNNVSYKIMTCDHNIFFHRKCINKMCIIDRKTNKKSKCPLCRKDLERKVKNYSTCCMVQMVILIMTLSLIVIFAIESQKQMEFDYKNN